MHHGIHFADDRLTDEEIRRNYEEYGHPDGKQEFSIGIALPKWIVESSNGYYMLGIYGLSFGVLLPAMVGRWWYGSRRLTREGIETKTAASYFKAVKENATKEDIVEIISKSHEYQTYLMTGDRTHTLDTVSLEKALAQAGIVQPVQDTSNASYTETEVSTQITS
jgi:translocation protein SEC63